MSPWREAFVAPVVFLTVALAGGFRLAVGGPGMRFVPPPVFTLVLALLLVAVLVRAGVLLTWRLMGHERRGLENLCGAVVLVTLFAAGAQLFNCLTPEAGLLRLLFALFFFFLLSNTLAARPGREPALRSLLVVFGGAFVTKYVVLAALAEPGGGVVRRALVGLLNGVTLGSLAFDPPSPVVGYVAFFAIVLYMIGLMLLPRPAPTALARVVDAPPPAALVEGGS